MDWEQIARLADLHETQNGAVAQEVANTIITSSADHHRFSLDILAERFSNSSAKRRKLPDTTSYGGGNTTTVTGLSTDEIIKLAGARLIIQSSSTKTGEDNVDPLIADAVNNHEEGLTHEESQNVELIERLLRSAKKFETKSGEPINNNGGCLGSRTGNPIQRAAYYFSSALQERERRRRTSSSSLPINEVVLPAGGGCWEYYLHGRVPFFMASQLAGVQAILESVGSARRVHVVDLKIRSGLAMVALMQAVVSNGSSSSRQLELLKVTAVANDESEEEKCRETGVRLASSAREMNVPFVFKIAKAQAINGGLGKNPLVQVLHPKEARVIYSEYALSPLISTPTRLHALMRLVETVHPRLMVVIDTEANHNSPDFGHRFVDSLFTAAAAFDCLADCCTAADEEAVAAREAVEAGWLGERITNVVAAEGEERVVRDVRIGAWRKYFARCGMLEIKLSELAVRHARLVVSRFPCGGGGGSCGVGADGKSVVMGWKGTPLVFVSTWKFVGTRKAGAAIERNDVVLRRKYRKAIKRRVKEVS